MRVVYCFIAVGNDLRVIFDKKSCLIGGTSSRNGAIADNESNTAQLTYNGMNRQSLQNVTWHTFDVWPCRCCETYITGPVCYKDRD